MEETGLGWCVAGGRREKLRIGSTSSRQVSRMARIGKRRGGAAPVAKVRWWQVKHADGRAIQLVQRAAKVVVVRMRWCVNVQSLRSMSNV